jgi:Tol biopolymer transport system component
MKKLIYGLFIPLLILAFIPALSSSAHPEGKIAFASDRDGNYEIYVMNDDGTGVTRLTYATGSDTQPTWSPDGTKIAFTSNRDGNKEIYVMNVDRSGSPVNLTNNTSSDTEPIWSPNGTRIAFTSDRDLNTEIYVMDVDGKNQRNLTDSPYGDSSATWSPDSSRIVFQSDRNYPGWGGGIYTMDADGSNPNVLLGDMGVGYYFTPAWSPDGNAIAFCDYLHRVPDLSVFRFDGIPASGYGGYLFSCMHPTWSPDGNRIAFSGADAGQEIAAEIYVLNSGESSLTNLTNSPAADIDPDWLQRTLVCPQ